MKLDFSQMEEQVMKEFKGGRGELRARMHVDSANKIMWATLPPGSYVGLHTHEGDSEIVYIVSGTGKAQYEDGYEPLAPGDCHYCPPGHSHRLINDSDGDLTFFAVVPRHGAL